MLRQLLCDWVELGALELRKGSTYVVALTLHRPPSHREIERMRDQLGELLADLRAEGANVTALILQPGESIQVFELSNGNGKGTHAGTKNKKTKNQKVR